MCITCILLARYIVFEYNFGPKMNLLEEGKKYRKSTKSHLLFPFHRSSHGICITGYPDTHGNTCLTPVSSRLNTITALIILFAIQVWLVRYHTLAHDSPVFFPLLLILVTSKPATLLSLLVNSLFHYRYVKVSLNFLGADQLLCYCIQSRTLIDHSEPQLCSRSLGSILRGSTVL